MLRKTVLTTAIIGAGLGSMSGAAFAWDNHGHGDAKGCSNEIAAAAENGSGDSLGDTTGGDQALDASNVCDILNDNSIGSENNVATAGGAIRNGDLTDITRTSTSTSTETTDTTAPAPAAPAAPGGLDLGGLLGGLLG
ncbi:hypothetical protein [Actinomycetospora termitidis]|uniref:Secreted protein n=1 Tax=Actinomycetospora termitidis TaxID=3053470 RepID=A0ABT7M4I5_9PSEU|nr:hypothetical protein [Actinomycetospora sp. Odt1-22]MDL5155586.1 hypothetical protein [Actinomycetospora sp. Odt1-22]